MIPAERLPLSLTSSVAQIRVSSCPNNDKHDSHGLLLQIREPVRGKRKAPEPAADEDGRSDEEDLSSEDAPLPGEEDTEDSDESDADTVQHGNAEVSMDEAEESEDDEDMQTEPVSKGTGSVPGSTADNRKAPEAPGPAGKDQDEE